MTPIEFGITLLAIMLTIYVSLKKIIRDEVNPCAWDGKLTIETNLGNHVVDVSDKNAIPILQSSEEIRRIVVNNVPVGFVPLVRVMSHKGYVPLILKNSVMEWPEHGSRWDVVYEFAEDIKYPCIHIVCCTHARNFKSAQTRSNGRTYFPASALVVLYQN